MDGMKQHDPHQRSNMDTLRQKLDDPSYMAHAIGQLAQDLSVDLIERRYGSPLSPDSVRLFDWSANAP